MTFRLACAADIDTMVELHGTGFETGWDGATLGDFVANDLVVLAGDPPIGMLIVRHALDEAEIITLVIGPQAQRAGLGRGLLKHVSGLLLQHNIARMFLEVARDNVPAIALYRQVGFEQVGTRKGYYARHSEDAVDALVMSITLTSD